MPREMIPRARHSQKRPPPSVNEELGKLPHDKAELIVRACDEVIEGKLDDHFPLRVWQTGSGTQTNMNAKRSDLEPRDRARRAASWAASSRFIQTTTSTCRSRRNDTFPTAMYIAAAEQLNALIPRSSGAARRHHGKGKRVRGRGEDRPHHLQDATPLTSIRKWAAGQVCRTRRRTIEAAMPGLLDLAIGGTAVGTGLNSHPEFGERAAKKIAELTGLPFRSHPNKFAALSAHDELVLRAAA
jgi:fumarate hydratase class II